MIIILHLYSTEAVLAKVLHLLNFSVKAQTAAIDFVLKKVVEIIPSSIESLKKAKNLIKKYSDLPMDYADATIVCLAVDTGIHDIITFDQKDFNIYRVKNKPFVISPSLDLNKIEHFSKVSTFEPSAPSKMQN
ncbi:MAG: PIN domain-containing protein [Desulfobacterales bacterium]